MDRKPRGRPKEVTPNGQEKLSALTTRLVVEIPLANFQPDLPLFLEEAPDKETVKNIQIKSSEPLVKPSGSTVFPRPGPGNQATVEDEIDVDD